MTDETRILKNTLLAYGSRFVVAAIGLAMVPYLIGHLGQSCYGLIGIAGSILQLMLLIELGIRPAVVRQFTTFLFGGEIKRSNEVVSTAFAAYQLMTVAILLTMGLGGKTFLVAMKVPVSLQPEARMVLMLVSLSVCVGLLRVPFGAVLAAHLRYDVESYMKAIGVVFHALFVVVVFSLWAPRLLVWAVANVLGAITTFVVFYRYAYRECASLEVRIGHVSKRGLGDLAGFSAYTGLSRLAGWLGQESGPLVISYFLGAAAVTHYWPAASVILGLQMVLAAFILQLYPVVAKAWATGELGRIQRVLVRSTRYSLVVGGGIMVLVASLVFRIIPAWLGEGFGDTCWVLMFYALSRFLHSGVAGAYPIFVGTGRVGVMAGVNCALAVMSVLISVYTVGWTSYGVVGVAFGILMAQSVRTVVWFLYSTSVCSLNRKQYLRESFLGPVICLVTLAAVSATTQQVVDLKPLWELLVVSGLATTVYAVLAWKVGFNAEDRTKAVSYLAGARQRVSALVRNKRFDAAD